MQVTKSIDIPGKPMSSDSLASEMFVESVPVIYSALRIYQVCTQELIMSTLSAKKLLAELMECLHDVDCKDERISQWALSSVYHIHIYNIFPSRVVLLVTCTIEDDVFLLNVLKINKKSMWIVRWNSYDVSGEVHSRFRMCCHRSTYVYLSFLNSSVFVGVDQGSRMYIYWSWHPMDAYFWRERIFLTVVIFCYKY
jgi:hypothetical protein